MFPHTLFLILMLVKIFDLCIPTQNVITTASILEDIALLEAGVPVVLTPAEQAAIAAFLATTETTTVELTTTTATVELTTTTTAAITTTTTDTTTTTTTVTTTTTTPYPCSVCPPIYDATCQGLNMPSPAMYCLTAAEVPISYTLGACSPCAVPDACYLSLACPAGTAARIDNGGSDINGNADGSPTLVYCSESIGAWFAQVDGGTVSPVNSISCDYP